jgi:hypothetical protein
MDSLEKEKKSLKSEVESLKAELEKTKHENSVLRDSNINFQVELYNLKLEKSQNVIGDVTVEEFIVEEQAQILKPVQKTITEKTEIVTEPQSEYEEIVEVIEEDSQDEYSESQDETNHTCTASENPSQESIQQKYKINLEGHQLETLNEVEPGDRNDSKFLNIILPWLFDKKTLVNSTVTGKPYTNRKNPGEPSVKSRLDPRKMMFIKGE